MNKKIENTIAALALPLFIFVLYLMARAIWAIWTIWAIVAVLYL